MQINPYLNEIKALRNYYCPILVLLLLSYWFYNAAGIDTVILLGKEDSFFEWLTALFYFISFILLVLTFKKNRNIFLLLLSFVLFFGAGEEISWGQRVFGFATPENINKVNVQHEFNIHNLGVFAGKYMDGERKKGWERFLEMDLLFKIFTVTFGCLLPFCIYHFKPIASLAQKIKVPVPPITSGIFFVISWIGLKFSLSRVPRHLDMQTYWKVKMAGPEIAEFIGAYIMFVICLYFYNYRNKDIMGKDFKQF